MCPFSEVENGPQKFDESLCTIEIGKSHCLRNIKNEVALCHQRKQIQKISTWKNISLLDIRH